MAQDVKDKYDLVLTKVAAIGISGMMHGYLPFDKDGELLVPFRTWRNTITGQAATELTEVFGFNIPQRWSIAHLYQAVLNQEEHVDKIHSERHARYLGNKLRGALCLDAREHQECSNSGAQHVRRAELPRPFENRSLAELARNTFPPE